MREARGMTQGSVRLDRDGSTPKATTPTETTTTTTLAKASKANHAATIRSSELTALAKSAEEDSDGHGANDDAETRHCDGSNRKTESRRRRQVVTGEAATEVVTDISAVRGQRGPEGTAEQVAASGLRPSRTRRWGYRRGPREKLRRNLFGRFAPVFFYPLAQVLLDHLPVARMNICVHRNVPS